MERNVQHLLTFKGHKWRSREATIISRTERPHLNGKLPVDDPPPICLRISCNQGVCRSWELRVDISRPIYWTNICDFFTCMSIVAAFHMQSMPPPPCRAVGSPQHQLQHCQPAALNSHFHFSKQLIYRMKNCPGATLFCLFLVSMLNFNRQRLSCYVLCNYLF